MYKNPTDIESSYIENDTGKTLYDLVMRLKPKTIIEHGVLFGYSTVAMAMALDDLAKESPDEPAGKIIAYDLWDTYPFKHSTMAETQANIDRYGLGKYVELMPADVSDFSEWIKNPEPFDLLHVDISNRGDTLLALHEGTKDMIKNGATVVFEGGTEERDNVEWMVKYNRPKMIGCGAPYEVIDPRFPGLSMMKAE